MEEPKFCRTCGKPFVSWQGNGSTGYYATRCIECRHRGHERRIRELRVHTINNIGTINRGDMPLEDDYDK